MPKSDLSLSVPCTRYKTEFVSFLGAQSSGPQIRYAHYFEELLRRIRTAGPDAEPPPTAQNRSPAVALLRLRVHAVPRLSDGGAGLAVEVCALPRAHRGARVRRVNHAACCALILHAMQVRAESPR